MLRDHYELKKKLNARARRIAEDARMNAAELTYWPAFWAVIIVLAVALLVAPR